jgi:hypothetical protein
LRTKNERLITFFGEYFNGYPLGRDKHPAIGGRSAHAAHGEGLMKRAFFVAEVAIARALILISTDMAPPP